MFKILNGYENIDSNIFFEIKESKITRGHNYTLVKKQSRLDVRKYSFSQRTINVWNKLSTDCVHATSVVTFINRAIEVTAGRRNSCDSRRRRSRETPVRNSSLAFVPA